jgi:hypothetical protein
MIDINFFEAGTKLHILSLRSKIMHFRQFEGKEPSQYGGHTVMLFANSNIVTVAKCNPKDKFSRRKGVITCIQKYLDRFDLGPQYPKGLQVFGFESNHGEFMVDVTNEGTKKYWWC